MVFLTTKIMQRTALFVTFGGLVTSLITTFLPFWKTMNSELNEVENWFSGLFHTCLYTEEVGIQCKAYESVLGLPKDLQISRVLMSVSIGTGGLAVIVAFPALEGVEMCVGQPGQKRVLLILSAVLSLVSGLTTLAPVSIVAYTTVVDFWDEGFPDVMPRWEYGEAMFSGWFGGLALVIGGTLFFVAVCMGDYDQRSASMPSSPQLKRRTQHYSISLTRMFLTETILEVAAFVPSYKRFLAGSLSPSSDAALLIWIHWLLQLSLAPCRRQTLCISIKLT